MSLQPESVQRQCLTLLVASCMTAGLDNHDLMLERKAAPLWTVHTSVWTLQSDVVSTRQ